MVVEEASHVAPNADGHTLQEIFPQTTHGPKVQEGYGAANICACVARHSDLCSLASHQAFSFLAFLLWFHSSRVCPCVFFRVCVFIIRLLLPQTEARRSSGAPARSSFYCCLSFCLSPPPSPEPLRSSAASTPNALLGWFPCHT